MPLGAGSFLFMFLNFMFLCSLLLKWRLRRIFVAYHLVVVEHIWFEPLGRCSWVDDLHVVE